MEDLLKSSGEDERKSEGNFCQTQIENLHFKKKKRKRSRQVLNEEKKRENWAP